MSTFIPLRVGVSAVALFSLLLVGCNSAGTASDSSSALDSSELVVPQVESTYENLQACNEHAQPKDFVASGSGMNATITFYTQLSNASTEALSRLFALVAMRASELAPYYDADSFPPQEMMTNFQGAIYALDLLCSKVLEGGGLSSESTVIQTNESVPSDGTEIPTNVDGIYANEACNYIAQKIYFDPWGWDIYDIKADAEIDFGKTIGGRSYGTDGYLRNSFNKYIKILNSASLMTSDGMISGVFQTIANELQEYVDTHDPIPYPDFERDFDQQIIKLVSMSKQQCMATIKTDDATTTTISAYKQTAIDEQLFQEMLYKQQQELENAQDTPQDYRKWWQISVENSYPPYREFVTDSILNRCLDRVLDTSSNFTVDYLTLKIGSSVPTPDWVLKITPPGGQAIKSFKPSDFGRTYAVRVSQTKLGYKPEHKEFDMHYVIIDGKAYQFSNFDFCLDLQG
jgi:hypothetical protein